MSQAHAADAEDRFAELADEVRAIMDDADVDPNVREQDLVRRGGREYPVAILSMRVDTAPASRYADALERAGFETDQDSGGKALRVRRENSELTEFEPDQ